VPDKILKADISKACDDHDKNYSSGLNKLVADAIFVADVYTQCVAGNTEPEDKGTIKAKVVKGVCAATAYEYGAAVTIFGQGAYDEAQKAQIGQ